VVADGPTWSPWTASSASIPVGTAELDDGFFRLRTGSVSVSERAYLRASAELGPGTIGSSDVARLLGKDPGGVGLRYNLIKRALCYAPHWADTAFTVPLFDQYMRLWIRDPRF
jgi:hypothetical protein